MTYFDNYPISKKFFLGWLKETYGISEGKYITIPVIEQYRGIARFLGYSVVFDDDLSDDDIKEIIIEYLYKYESVLRTRRYINRDMLEKINRMSYDELSKEFPEITTPADIKVCLNRALIRIGSSGSNFVGKDYTMPKEYISEAIIASKMPLEETIKEKAEPIEEEKTIIPEIFTGKSDNEEAPF